MNKWVSISVMAVLAIGVIAVGFLYLQESSKLKDAESDISGLQTNVSTLQTNVSTLQGTVSTLETELNDSQATVSSLEADYAAAQSEIQTLEAELSQVQGDYDTLSQKVAKSKLYVQLINATTDFEIDRLVIAINDPILREAWGAVLTATTDDAWNAAVDAFWVAVFDRLEAALR